MEGIMTGEVWRVVPTEPQFLVSSEGRIMISPFWGEMPHGAKRPYGGAPQFGVWSKTDARFIIVYRGKTYKVHRLVCEAFNGQAPNDKPYCLHRDENSANNRADNVYWGDQKENLNATGFVEYCKARTGEDSPFIKGRRKKSLLESANG
jgi:hypothetical protein